MADMKKRPDGRAADAIWTIYFVGNIHFNPICQEEFALESTTYAPELPGFAPRNPEEVEIVLREAGARTPRPASMRVDLL
jgi:hypothetical protein